MPVMLGARPASCRVGGKRSGAKRCICHASAFGRFSSSGGGNGGRGKPHGSDGGTGDSGDGVRSWLGQWSWLPAALAIAQLGMLPGEAKAARKEAARSKQDVTPEAIANALWAVSGPVLTNFGFSGVTGIVAGMALKRVGQLMAVVVGLAFVALQGLTYTGIITVNWTHIHSTLGKVLDVNKDGKLSDKDFKAAVVIGLDVLAQGVPSAGGFCAGFLIGLRI
mmetsp:Transcript_21866/g.37366  ORF Transcript_21866/g.37366 Transcript_21866/m.37366 type:complete len:222 (-) Transcript_21866:250-915(-)